MSILKNKLLAEIKKAGKNNNQIANHFDNNRKLWRESHDKKITNQMVRSKFNGYEIPFDFFVEVMEYLRPGVKAVLISQINAL